MSGKDKNKGPARRRKVRNSNVPMIATFGGLLAIVVLLIVLNVRRAEARHPEPRATAENIRLDSADRYHDAHVASTYRKAGKIKQIVDGLFCYCFCKGGGHYSLLDCFRDEHGSTCDICMGEADLAYEMNQKGATLEEIRAEVDRQFGGAH